MYDPQLDAMEGALRQAVAAVKAKATDAQAQITKLMERTNTLLSALESDEQAAEAAAQ